MPCTSVSVSSSQSSMCEDATRISCGPFRVPGTYDVVRSSGIGKMTTRALAKLAVVGMVPPNSPTAMRSYSNGRFILGLETVGRESLAVNGHDARRQRERRPLAAAKDIRIDMGKRARQQRQCDGGVGLHRHACRIGGEFAPTLRLLERRSRRPAAVRHIGDHLERVTVAADIVVEKFRLHAGLVDEVFLRAAAQYHCGGARCEDHDIG